jgi:general secretion pathway protein K
MMRAHRQRGVALITAILMVALATVLAVEIGFKGYLSQRRAATIFALDQSYQVALGAEALAADALMASDARKTDFSQKWTTPIRLPIDGGEIEGQLEDLTGRFNLNHLAERASSGGQPPPTGQPGQQTTQQAYIEQFKRILEMAQLEPEWAGKIVDWLDADTNPQFPEGGEDDLYTSQTPPYLAANRRITRVSELLALPEFGLERYKKLEPLVSALPTDSLINLCTAPGIVLDSFSATQRQYSRDPDWLMKQRSGGCFPEKTVLKGALPTEEEKKHVDQAASESSDYFRANVVVTLGTNQFTLYSLLKRGASGVRPITRSFGTP